MAAEIPVVSIVGRSGSGKSTLLVKLVRELKQRGHRLAVIKHHHHTDLEFDVPGKDSYRFAQAGADLVVIAGPTKVVHVRQLASDLGLQDVIATIDEVDLIITEGYKQARTPQIEVSRSGTGQAAPGTEAMGSPFDLVGALDHLIALVSDRLFGLPVPEFGLDDVAELADFVEVRFLQRD